MNRTLLHRGPDEEGIFLRPQIGFGDAASADHRPPRRLQPIANEDDTVGSFNGETTTSASCAISSAAASVPRTDGDTEVIVHAYEESASGVSDSSSACSPLRFTMAAR